MNEHFHSFDRQATFTVQWGNLPHWSQQGTTCFITIRTNDSIPKKVLDIWKAERDVWLLRHGINPSKPNWHALVQELDAREYSHFRRVFLGRFERLLDNCYGECLLRDPILARVVTDSLLSFDGVRYLMGDFVIMPNHVHLLAQFMNECEMRKQCASWARYTARRINRILGRRGQLWQKEAFDHLVRSPEQFDYYRRYIAANPVGAHLKPGEYFLYRPPLLVRDT